MIELKQAKGKSKNKSGEKSNSCCELEAIVSFDDVNRNYRKFNRT